MFVSFAWESEHLIHPLQTDDDLLVFTCPFCECCKCVFVLRAGVVLLSWRSIERPQLRLLMGWCDKRSLPRSVTVCVCVGAAMDQCKTNHPTGASVKSNHAVQTACPTWHTNTLMPDWLLNYFLPCPPLTGIICTPYYTLRYIINLTRIKQCYMYPSGFIDMKLEALQIEPSSFSPKAVIL